MRRALSIAFDATGVARMSTFGDEVELLLVTAEVTTPGRLFVRNGAGQLIFSASTGQTGFVSASFFAGAHQSDPIVDFDSVNLAGFIDPVTGSTALGMTGSIIPQASGSRTVSVAIPESFRISPRDVVTLDMPGASGIAIFVVEDFAAED